MNFIKTEKKLIKFLKKSLSKTYTENFIVGISGGLDSAVVSALCAKAKPKNTFGLILPAKSSDKKNLNDAISHCEKWGIKYEIISIEPFLQAFRDNQNDEISRIRLGNFAARVRMSLLYDFSAKISGVVVGTSNLSERMLGYGTIYGDLACAFNPIGELFKTEIFEFAKFLNIDEKIISKAPSADLWEGQSDEGDLGYDYASLDEILLAILHKKSLAKFDQETINFIQNRIKNNKFKLKMPKILHLKG